MGQGGGAPRREKLAEVECERRGYQRLAAKGRMTETELDEALAEFE